MIDTARHYLPVATIKHAIEAMAAAKMNALHWHISDDQSFPLCLTSAPQLCAVAAYRDRKTGDSLNYTTADVRDLVAFAAARGVRVIPELDLPGHSAAFARAAPSVYANCATSSSKLPDPRAKEAGGQFYTLLDAMMTEISSLFPDHVMHMGGDEIKTDCWSASAEVQTWAKAQNLTTSLELVGYFQQRVQAIVSSHGKRTMFWDEFWAAGLPALNSTFAEVRGTLAAYTGLLDAGRPTLTTGISEAWYLDHGVCSPRFVQMDWEPYYTHDPFHGLSEAQLAMVLGGEVDMWGEGVDATNFESRVFPWASAVGERLWSPPARSSSISEAAGRLAEHRCMLVQRGVAAAPINTGMC
jgi:hexosaminidase